jgi:hypothetical protein
MFDGRNICVFDIEIKRPINECTNGWKSLDEMGVACLVMYDYKSMRYRVFDDHNMSEAMERLCEAELCVGFNTKNFDAALLEATYGKLPPPGLTHFDILREIWVALGLDPDNFNPKTHGGYKLDDVAWDTIKMKKTLSGEQAPILYQLGRLAEVIDYCLEDVRIEKTLFEFACNSGYVVRHKQIDLNIPKDLRLGLKDGGDTNQIWNTANGI